MKTNDYNEVKINLTEKMLQKQFLLPYEQGNAITVNGKAINSKDIERVLISRGEDNSKCLLQKII